MKTLKYQVRYLNEKKYVSGVAGADGHLPIRELQTFFFFVSDWGFFKWTNQKSEKKKVEIRREDEEKMNVLHHA